MDPSSGRRAKKVGNAIAVIIFASFLGLVTYVGVGIWWAVFR